jgi:hypothetical protein
MRGGRLDVRAARISRARRVDNSERFTQLGNFHPVICSAGCVMINCCDSDSFLGAGCRVEYVRLFRTRRRPSLHCLWGMYLLWRREMGSFRSDQFNPIRDFNSKRSPTLAAYTIRSRTFIQNLWRFLSTGKVQRLSSSTPVDKTRMASCRTIHKIAHDMIT